MRRRAAFLLAGLLAVAACGTSGPTAEVATSAPTSASEPSTKLIAQLPFADPCVFGAAVFDVGPVALCQQAVGLAIARLGTDHPAITSITFRQDLCPPNAPCAPPRPNESWVVFTFVGGGATMVRVAPAGVELGLNGPLIADAPDVLPAWLAAEMVGR